MNHNKIKNELKRFGTHLEKCKTKPQYANISDKVITDLYFMSNDAFPPEIIDLIVEDCHFFEITIEFYHNRFISLPILWFLVAY